MYMSVPLSQNLSSGWAEVEGWVVVVTDVDCGEEPDVVLDDAVDVVVLHCHWQVSSISSQFSVMSSVQHGFESAFTHSDWVWEITEVIEMYPI